MRHTLILYLKGIFMGIADLIPGVSGGTIALITGIYFELLRTITSFNLANLKLLCTGEFKAAWQGTNLTFLLPVLVGIASAVLSLSHLIHYLLEQHPVLVWAFFLGLVIGTIFLLTLNLGRFSLAMISTFFISMLLTYWLLNFISFSLSASYTGLFIAGFIAICAMILPGISGSFLLLIMGMYQPVIAIIKNFELTSIAIFASGALLGLLSFSRVLTVLFARYPKLLMAAMIGVMVGSANKLWPWQLDIQQYGLVLASSNTKLAVPPQVYQSVTAQDPYLYPAIGLFIVGIAFVVTIYRLSSPTPDKTDIAR
jgi:putative membrane protein